MGRRKVEIKRIEDKSSRQVTFSKRRNGLFKKARELSVLCDVDVSVLVCSSRGKLYQFSSSGSSLSEVLSRYWAVIEDNAASGDARKHDHFLSLESYEELLQGVQRDLESPQVEQLDITDFLKLENNLDTALRQVRVQKMQLVLESIRSFHDQGKLLKEENQLLEGKIADMKNNTADTNKVVLGIDNSSSDPPLVRPSRRVTLSLLR